MFFPAFFSGRPVASDVGPDDTVNISTNFDYGFRVMSGTIDVTRSSLREDQRPNPIPQQDVAPNDDEES